MARTVIAVYESFYLAGQAVQELQTSGLTPEMMDITAQPKREKPGANIWAMNTEKIKPEIRANGLIIGMQIGAGISASAGLMIGLLALTGAVPVISQASSLFSIVGILLALTAAGAVLGGALGNLLGVRIPEKEARQYARNVSDGDVVVAVLADWDLVDPVIETLSRFAPLEVQERTLMGIRPGRVGLSTAGQSMFVKRSENRDQH